MHLVEPDMSIFVIDNNSEVVFNDDRIRLANAGIQLDQDGSRMAYAAGNKPARGGRRYEKMQQVSQE